MKMEKENASMFKKIFNQTNTHMENQYADSIVKAIKYYVVVCFDLLECYKKNPTT